MAGNAEQSLNERAWRLADLLAADADAMGVHVHDMAGARVIDAGAKQRGSLRAGVAVAKVCLADLADVTLGPSTFDGFTLPSVSVTVDQPLAACMASQYAGWQIQTDDYFAMGSGPFRAAYGKEKLFDDIGHREKPNRVIGVLEGKLPNEGVVAKVAEQCGVSASQITLIAARTASLVGGVQVVARSVETALHKLHELKFDLSRIVSGFGNAPLPPVAKDDMAAIGKTNDSVLYGARVTLFVTGDDESLASIGKQLPSSASSDYGRPFGDIFKSYDHDFYKIDPMLFSPADICLQNIETGQSHRFGQVNEPVLLESFFGDGK